MMIFLLVILLLLVNYSTTLKYILPTKSFVRSINKNEIQVIEPDKTEPKDTYAALFLTGGNNVIPGDIYNHFLNSLAGHRFSVNLIPGNFNDYDDLFRILKKEYKGIVVLQHSSSTILAVNLSKKEKAIKKLIFLDPVDNRLFFEEYRKIDNQINLFSVKKILFLKASKSYKWSLSPPAIPFIPFLSLKPDSFNLNRKCKVTTVEATDFGHTDILDKSLSDFMHNSRISVGNNNREAKILMDYHKWLAKAIHYFCYHNDNEIKNILMKSELKFNITYNK